MADSQVEQLTRQFYEWEKWGRGWLQFETPVDLEPPFVPFFFHKQPSPYVDDGKHLTFFEKVVNLFKSSNENRPTEAQEEAIEPFPFHSDDDLCALSISLPKGEKVKAPEMEQLLLMLSFSEAPLSFEIVATQLVIRMQFVCRSADVFYVRSQIKAYFPSIIIRESDDFVWDILPDNTPVFGLEYGLRDEFMRPIVVAKSFDSDSYTGLFGILDHLQSGEQLCIQALFKGTVNSWAESIIRSVTDQQGGDFFLDAPEMLPLAKAKISSPLFAVSIRMVTSSETIENAQALAERVNYALIQLSTSESNKLIPLHSGNTNADTFFEDILGRQSHRLGMLLNVKELANFVHAPSPSITSTKLERDTHKTKASPAITENHNFVVGLNVHQGRERVVTLSEAQRLKHTHIIGATGTGKSTLLLNLIVNDLELGNGIAILDPHGDLIESIIERIPVSRIEDVIVIDPADSEYPVGFNILTAHSDIEREILSSDLVAAFKRLSTSWGDQMNSVFANAILAFLESESGGTLVDVRRFLIEKSFRDSFLKSVNDPNIVYYWQKEYPLLKSSSIGPILTRLDTFLRPKLIRNMVAQKKSIDFENVMSSKKILLIKLSQGLIGTENSYLLGTFIVSKIHQAAMARQATSKEERSDFFLYIDEFQNFITPSMSSILSGARKYHLGLILAHQDMQQLIKQDSELASSVLSNAGTRICFRVGDTDARKFEDGFSFFEAKDLQNLETGEAIVRVDRPEFDFNIVTFPLPEFDTATKASVTNDVISLSRKLYGTPRNQIEESLREFQEERNEDIKVIVQKPVDTRKPLKGVQEKLLKVESILQKEKAEMEIKEFTTTVIEKKEESQHRYLQTLIKRMAESRGYKAVIEEPTPDGAGRVDVGLFRNNKKIACEISVTTTHTWETHNIEKCLAAGYETVIVCSNDKKNLDRIQALAKEKLSKTLFERVLMLEPEALFLYLDQQVASESNKDERIKGYRVKVEYTAVPPKEMHHKKDSILKTISESMRKKKGRNED
ncbi:MAG: hypothetical protein RL641_430 [Candidatus Parcubacteria bacterium]|jgi:DNA helicase HerA-like ATPase